MNKFSATSFAALTAIFLTSTSAFAADIRGSVKDEPAIFTEAKATNWTGFYAGVHGGWSDWNFERPDDASSPTQEIEGYFGGGQIGYDVQLPGSFVLGVVADASVGDLSGDIYKDGSAITVDSEIDAFGTIRGRLGYSLGRIMPYVTGGAAWVVGSTSEHCPKGPTYSSHCNKAGKYDETDDFTRFGWAYGGGIAGKVNNHIDVFAEYLRLDFGTESHDLGPKSSDRDVRIDGVNVVKAGVNWRF